MSRNLTPYFSDLAQKISALGGYFNAHLHLDRAGTYDYTVQLLQRKGVRDGAALSLAKKHAVIPLIHSSHCYDPEALIERVEPYVKWMQDHGTRRADTLVDVTTDRVGLTALTAFQTIKNRFIGGINLQLGAYSPFGFRDDEPERWELLAAGAETADFIGLLPERDDVALYPEHIGFEESCRRGIILSLECNKPIHIHVDQANHQFENGAESVIKVMRELGISKVAHAEPMVWLIHLISPSTYTEERFTQLVLDLVELNIGVICCPSAAISMRQYRPLQSPTSNSIARVLELLAEGVHVRMGSDNICDITSPMGTVDMMPELFVLANATRFYGQDILAKIAAGLRIDISDQEILRAHLAEDATFVAAVVDSHGHENR